MYRIWIISLRVLMIIFCIIFLSLLGFIMIYNPVNPQASQKSIFILGAGYQSDGTPVPALKRRLCKGIEIWKRYQELKSDSYIIISGHEDEINVMNDFLIDNNVLKQYIIQDIYGTNTRATIINSKNIIKKYSLSPIYISQAYHLPRILLYSKYFRISNAQFIASDRLPLSITQMVPIAVRETVAILAFPFLELYRYLKK